MATYVNYANQGATRNLPLDSRLVEAFSFLPEMGLAMEVFSGGQPSAGNGPRVGSTRHDHGGAADVFFTRNGQRLNWANEADLPVFQDIVRKAKAAGVTGFGAGPGYMQPGSMHVGFGSPSVWGAGGKGANAPGWLREAYGATPAASGGSSLARLMDPAPMARQEGQIQPNAQNIDAVKRAMLGDLLAPKPVAQDFASVIQNHREQQERERAEKEADDRRRAALFSGLGAHFG